MSAIIEGVFLLRNSIPRSDSSPAKSGRGYLARHGGRRRRRHGGLRVDAAATGGGSGGRRGRTAEAAAAVGELSQDEFLC